mgnify:CR=1 FL=1
MTAIILSFLISTLTCFFIIRYSHLHKHLTSDPVKGGPQKFHTRPTPRISGVAIVAGMLASAGIFMWQERPFVTETLLLLGCSLPAFLSGLAEDITKKVGALWRLFFTIVAACLAFFLLDAKLTRVSLPFVDNWLLFMPFSLLLTIVAVAGVSNAVNIIDGFNGLATGVSLLIFGSLSYVSFKVNDFFLLFLCLSMIGAIIGFFIWNYPNGMIFLGDGGAYFIGFVIAVVSVLLVNRHPEVSPWFPMLLVAYPVWETMFSIYRKKFIRGQSPGMPDGLHFHMIVYKRLLQWTVGKKEAKYFTRRNAMTSPYLWMLSLFSIIPAVLFWQNTSILMVFVVLFILMYLWIYWRIVKFKTPKWLVRKGRDS